MNSSLRVVTNSIASGFIRLANCVRASILLADLERVFAAQGFVIGTSSGTSGRARKAELLLITATGISNGFKLSMSSPR